MKNIPIANLLLENLAGIKSERPLFKTYKEMFEKAVAIPGHEFSAVDFEDRIHQSSRLKQSFHNLVSGKRQNRTNKRIEKTLWIVIEKELIKRNKVNYLSREQFEKVIRNIPLINLQVNTFADPFKLPDTNTIFAKQLREAHTIFIVCIETFMTYLLSSNDALPITEAFWDIIILEQKPSIELNVAYEENQCIWDILIEHLGYFLTFIAVDRYKDNALIQEFYKKSGNERKKILRSILFEANRTKILGNSLPRLSVKVRRHPCAFDSPMIMINPYVGDAAYISFRRDENNLIVFSRPQRDIDIWKKYDRKYIQVLDETKLVRDFLLE